MGTLDSPKAFLGIVAEHTAAGPGSGSRSGSTAIEAEAALQGLYSDGKPPAVADGAYGNEQIVRSVILCVWMEQTAARTASYPPLSYLTIEHHYHFIC